MSTRRKTAVSAIRKALGPNYGIDPVLFGSVVPKDQVDDKTSETRASMAHLCDGWTPVIGHPSVLVVPYGFCGTRAASGDAYVVIDSEICAPLDTRGYRMRPAGTDGNVIENLDVVVANSAGPEEEYKCVTKYNYKSAVAIRISESRDIDVIVAVVFADDPPGVIHYGLAHADFGLSVAVRKIVSGSWGSAETETVVVAVPETGIHRVLYCARMFPVYPGKVLSYFARRPPDSPLESLFSFPKIGSMCPGVGIYGMDLGSTGPVHFPDARWANMFSSSFIPGTEEGRGTVVIHTKGVKCIGTAVDPVFPDADRNGDVRVDITDAIGKDGYAFINGCSYFETTGPNRGKTVVRFSEPGTAEMGEWQHKPLAVTFGLASYAAGRGGILSGIADWFSGLFSTTKAASAVIVYSMPGGRPYDPTEDPRRDDFTRDAIGGEWLAGRGPSRIPLGNMSLVPVLSGPDSDGISKMERDIEDSVADSRFTFIHIACHGGRNGTLMIGGGIKPSVISAAIDRGAARADGQVRRVFILVASCYSGDFFNDWAPASNLSVLIWSATGSDNVAYGVGGTTVPWDRGSAYTDGHRFIRGEAGRASEEVTVGVFIASVARAILDAGINFPTYSQVFEEAKRRVAEATAIREREYNRMFGGNSPTRMHQVPDADSNNASFEHSPFMS